MEFFGIGAPIWLVLCGLLCAGVFVLGFILPILDVVFEVIGAVIGFAFEIFNAGPVPGCGCIVLAMLILGCMGASFWFTDALSTCGTPDQVNLCRIF